MHFESRVFQNPDSQSSTDQKKKKRQHLFQDDNTSKKRNKYSEISLPAAEETSTSKANSGAEEILDDLTDQELDPNDSKGLLKRQGMEINHELLKITLTDVKKLFQDYHQNSTSLLKEIESLYNQKGGIEQEKNNFDKINKLRLLKKRMSRGGNQSLSPELGQTSTESGQTLEQQIQVINQQIEERERIFLENCSISPKLSQAIREANEFFEDHQKWAANFARKIHPKIREILLADELKELVSSQLRSLLEHNECADSSTIITSETAKKTQEMIVRDDETNSSQSPRESHDHTYPTTPYESNSNLDIPEENTMSPSDSLDDENKHVPDVSHREEENPTNPPISISLEIETPNSKLSAYNVSSELPLTPSPMENNFNYDMNDNAYGSNVDNFESQLMPTFRESDYQAYNFLSPLNTSYEHGSLREDYSSSHINEPSHSIQASISDSHQPISFTNDNSLYPSNDSTPETNDKDDFPENFAATVPPTEPIVGMEESREDENTENASAKRSTGDRFINYLSTTDAALLTRGKEYILNNSTNSHNGFKSWITQLTSSNNYKEMSADDKTKAYGKRVIKWHQMERNGQEEFIQQMGKNNRSRRNQGQRWREAKGIKPRQKKGHSQDS